jgi:hypothetical protein
VAVVVKKGHVFLFRATKAYNGSGGTAPPTLNLGNK